MRKIITKRLLSCAALLGVLACFIYAAAKAKPADGATAATPPVTFERMEFGGRQWLVLKKQGGKALLITEEVAGYRAYNETLLVAHDITWENCDLRGYLNGEFYEQFSAADRARIAPVTNKNLGNADGLFRIPGGNDTLDHVFLLSMDEVKAYFKLKNNETWEFPNDVTDACWLRSPGQNASHAAAVDFAKGIDSYGLTATFELGLRPALWVRLDN